MQHVNRKQDTNHLYLADVSSGSVTLVMTEQAQTFLDFVDDARWLDDGEGFIWISKRSGWRHLYRISRDGKTIQNLTNGEFDITAIKAIDQENGWLYFIAAPNNVTQHYLYRSKLDGSTINQRVTPMKYQGFNQYQMASNGSWAVHSHSSFNQLTQNFIVKMPHSESTTDVATQETKHATKQTLILNEALQGFS